MTAEITVRRLRLAGPDAGDLYGVLDQIVEIQREAFRFSDAQLVPAYGLEMTNWTFGVWSGGVLTGYALCCLSEDSTGLKLELTLQQTGIRKNQRRHHLGTALMREIVCEVRRSHFPIHWIKWSQDPLLARVANFYICPEVGGRGVGIVKNRYGILTGNYQGLPTHRLDVRLNPHQKSPAARFPDGQFESAFEAESMSLLGRPVPRWSIINGRAGYAPPFVVPIPSDFEKLKTDTPDTAAQWQEGVVSVLGTLCQNGYEVVNFRASPQSADFGEYLLVRTRA